MTKKVMVWILAAVASAGAAVQGGGPAAAFGSDVKWIKGAAVPEFLKGTVYVVDLWGTWCPPCLAEIPHMKKVADQYRGRGVVFTAIAISPEYGVPVADFVRAKGDLMPYT